MLQLNGGSAAEKAAADAAVGSPAGDLGAAEGESEQRAASAADNTADDADASCDSSKATASHEAPRKQPLVRPKLTRRRASDAPIIDVPRAEYLRVLEAIAGLTSKDSPTAGAGDASREQLEQLEQLEKTLRGWGMNPAAWLAQFEQLDHRCTRALGAAHHMMQRAVEVALRWFHGLGWCREIFTEDHSQEFT